ncbi:hypothetical protein FACS189479_05650 [Spirochaetia bacterium]|nr:hypothetical protein FACS189479_05650 [Spirochaetia bacterium]
MTAIRIENEKFLANKELQDQIAARQKAKKEDDLSSMKAAMLLAAMNDGGMEELYALVKEIAGDDPRKALYFNWLAKSAQTLAI